MTGTLTFPGEDITGPPSALRSGIDGGPQGSAALSTVRLAMAFAGEVLAVAGNVAPPASFRPHQLFRKDRKLVTSAEDAREDLTAAVRAALLKFERPARRSH